MNLKKYQKTAVDTLIQKCKRLLQKGGQRVCVLKAPTGSGKTIMVADFLDKLVKEQLPSPYAFVWISGNNLHEQSREKLECYLHDSRFSFSYLDEIQNTEFKENEIVFVNWHSLTKQDKKTGEYTNVFMRDNENDRNLRTFIANTKERGIQIILIVDESHYHYWSDKSQGLVHDVIAPTLTLEVSATPKLEPSAEDIASEESGFVCVKFDEVVAAGMIKTDVVINEELKKYADLQHAADEAIIAAALEKQKQLVDLYKQGGIAIRPLLLIQLPSESEKTSALDLSKLEMVESLLKETHHITVENGKLGVWLSERKDNIDHIEHNDCEVDVLIFKQAIALGWDCPRAQILVMLREIKSVTFEIQTVGRILRMPEQKHYDSDTLNRAYVYTNLEKLNIALDRDSQGFFSFHPSHRQATYTPLKLPSVYLRRVDYKDLTLSFRRLFIDEANKYFGITSKDMPQVGREKADVKLDLLPEELTKPIIADAVMHNIDQPQTILGETAHFKVAEDELKYKFTYLAKTWSLPFAPERSHTKIQQAIYDWFDNYVGYKNASRLEIQRIVVCSANNQKIFTEIINAAKARFKDTTRKEIESKARAKSIVWEVPERDYFGELYEHITSDNYACDACYLLKDRSKPERELEHLLSHSKKVSWWYKNGVGKETYFGISYVHPEDGMLHTFYPDYLVAYSDGQIGIYDTKAGITATEAETAAKSDALQAYIKRESEAGRKITGGIIVLSVAGLQLFTGSKYTASTNKKSWERLQI